jgi:hypothetical protein
MKQRVDFDVHNGDGYVHVFQHVGALRVHISLSVGQRGLYTC